MNKNKVKIKKEIIKRPSINNDFWSLEGSLKSEVKLSNDQLKEARKSFSRNWADKNNYF